MIANEPVHGRARVIDADGVTVRTWKFADADRPASGCGTARTSRQPRRTTAHTRSGSTASTPPATASCSRPRCWWIARSSTSPGRASRSSPATTRRTASRSSCSARPPCPCRSTAARRSFAEHSWTSPCRKGTWTWSWNGLNGHRELVEPGVYTATVTTTSWVGVSRLTRTVTVLAPWPHPSGRRVADGGLYTGPR